MGAQRDTPKLEFGDKATWVALGLILLAVLFRCWAVGSARFTGDESYFWASARNIARFQAAPVYGPQMTGSSAYHPGPLFYYLMAIPQLLGNSPIFGGVFVAILHGLAGWLLFSAVRLVAGGRAGCLALGVFAFAPWDVLYADRIWLSCVAPVWGAAIFYSALRVRDAPRWQGILLFFALTCPQLHMSAPVVWVSALVLVVLAPPEAISKRSLGIGAVLVVLAYGPPLYWELTHGFTNTKAILAKAGGEASGTSLLLLPAQVFGYALLYGSSEIGYHFARGYWTPFDPVSAYGSAAGWAAWWRQHGLFWGGAGVVSLVAAGLAWGRALVRLGRRWRSRGFRDEDPETRIIFALIAGLVAGALLLVVSRKPYFPHYTNLLMPMLLIPLALAAEDTLRLRDRWKKIVGAIAFALIVVSMAGNSTRYYRDVDALNGLANTVSMVDEVMDDSRSIRALSFDGFNNTFAWQMLANTAYARPIPIEAQGTVQVRVRNRSPHRGPPPEGSTVHGIILLERSPVSRGRP